MRRRRRLLALLLAAGLLAAAGALLVRQGAVPVDWSPLPPLDLAEPDPWFVDWRLAELKHSPHLCSRVLRPPWIMAGLVDDRDLEDGCGWRNAVDIRSIAGARARVNPATCELAAALALWMAHVVQPRAQEILGARVSAVQHLGGYACRNIKGNPAWSTVRSQHARANALDVSGFTLVGGRQVRVARHWHGDSPESRFLHAIHAGACRYFRVAIGPDYNALHRTHFHLDRGLFSACQ